jgi:hypothetical protein
MALKKTPILTSDPLYGSDGMPLAGVQVTYRLSWPDRDGAAGAYVHNVALQYVSLDSTGSLPAGFGLWPNAAGIKHSVWFIGLRQSDGKNGFVTIRPEVPCYVTDTPAGVELLTLLDDGETFPGS